MAKQTNLWAVEAYPKAGFQNDLEAQQVVTTRMKTQGKYALRLFFSWVAVFFASGLFGFSGFGAVTIAGMGLLFIMLLPLAFLILYAPVPDCPRCCERMKKEWAVIDPETELAGEFMICPACHIFLYNHRTVPFLSVEPDLDSGGIPIDFR